jgi:hypothetical protein
MARKITRQQAVEELWHRGELSWKWRPVQHRMNACFAKARGRRRVLNCSRRIGKSFLLMTKAFEHVLQNPRWPVKYAAPNGIEMKKTLLPIAREIIADCPEDSRPVWHSQDKAFKFPNGGEIHIAGVNSQHEDDLRGAAAGLAIVDEAGFVDRLEYLVESVLMPQLLTTGGELILSSTPPRTPAHDFVAFVEEAKLKDAYAEFDIHQSGYPQALIDEFCSESGGMTSTTWQREYLCQFVIDQDFAIVPEWSDKFIEERPRDVFDRFYHAYSGMDLGVIDLTVDELATYDFKRGILYFEDEVVMHGPQMTTDKLAAAITAKEAETFTFMVGTDKRVKVPRMRVADNNNLLLLNDLAAAREGKPGIQFQAVTKDDLVAMVNEFRMWMSSGRVRVSKKCRQLLGCLRAGVWDDKQYRRNFARSRDFGHFDALAAAIYLVRYVDRNTNPIPADFGLDGANQFIPSSIFKSVATQENAIKALVGLS